MSNPTTAVIAAAGRASRMWPASKVFSKEFFPLGRIPAIVYIVWEFLEAGITDIIIVASAQNRSLLAGLFDRSKASPPKIAADPIVSRFENSLRQCSISIIEQTGHYGNGTPLQQLRDRIGERPCLYAFSDDIIIGENVTGGLIGVYERTGLPVMAVQEVAAPRRELFGILECEMQGDINYISRLIEKPRIEDTTSNLASFGRYLVTPPLLEILSHTDPGHNGEVWFTDAVITYLRGGQRACAFSLSRGNWYTVGDPDGYALAVEAATAEQLRLANGLNL